MISTNIERMEGELGEVISEFPENQPDIVLNFNEGDNFVYTLVCCGETRVYSYAVSYDGAVEKKRLIKRFAKLSLYDFISERTGVSLPWGALTGIRPTKLYYSQGGGSDFLRDTMRVSDKKLRILEKIVQAQKPYYEVNEDNAAFYVGVPFCPTRCAYCSFISCEIGKLSAVNEYIEALCKEITQSKKLVKNLRSVYIGGGTPVSPSLENIEKILKTIGEVGVEYTVEAGRPDCINDEVLKLLKNYNVGRVCVNPQTFSDATLKLMGRNHTGADAVEKYFLAKKYGFKVNMDLIAGLPLETFDVFAASLERAIELRPENITVHTLCLKKGSKLKEMCSRLPEGEVARMIDYSSARLEQAGYNPYYLYRQKYMAGNLENTGYSLPGEECVYNIDVMEETAQNIACGANAVSKRIFPAENRIERLGAPKDVRTYIDKTDKLISDKIKIFT